MSPLSKEEHCNRDTLDAQQIPPNMPFRIVKMRNLIVHNRGIVNRTYKSRVAEDQTPLGERLTLDGKELVDNAQFLNRSVMDILYALLGSTWLGSQGGGTPQEG